MLTVATVFCNTPHTWYNRIVLFIELTVHDTFSPIPFRSLAAKQSVRTAAFGIEALPVKEEL